MSYLSIREVLDYMAIGKIFSMKVVAYDHKRQKGGHIIEYPEAVQVVKKDEAERDKRPATRQEQLRAKVLEHKSKIPSHGKHYTRNINVLQDGHPTSIIRKIHPILIIEFNNKKVVP